MHPTELGNHAVSILWWKHLSPVVELQVHLNCMKNSVSWSFGGAGVVLILGWLFFSILDGQ